MPSTTIGRQPTQPRTVTLFRTDGYGSGSLITDIGLGITDGLMRLPVGDPVVTSIEDPLLRGFYLAFLVTYIVGFIVQVRWLRKQSALD